MECHKVAKNIHKKAVKTIPVLVKLLEIKTKVISVCNADARENATDVLFNIKQKAKQKEVAALGNTFCSDS